MAADCANIPAPSLTDARSGQDGGPLGWFEISIRAFPGPSRPTGANRAAACEGCNLRQGRPSRSMIAGPTARTCRAGDQTTRFARWIGEFHAGRA
jgi:hypothetical protein